MFRPVARIAIPKGKNPVFPTASMRAAGQSAIGVNELVMRIGFPVRRFTTAGDYDAGAVGWPSRMRFDGCGQVH
jgi:hypothetical protein